jgi:hypothetical protein
LKNQTVTTLAGKLQFSVCKRIGAVGIANFPYRKYGFVLDKDRTVPVSLVLHLNPLFKYILSKNILVEPEYESNVISAPTPVSPLPLDGPPVWSRRPASMTRVL